MERRFCAGCGRSGLLYLLNEEVLCSYCQKRKWLAEVDPKELVGCRVRRNAAWEDGSI